jgi:hypothetical protein
MCRQGNGTSLEDLGQQFDASRLLPNQDFHGTMQLHDFGNASSTLQSEDLGRDTLAISPIEEAQGSVMPQEVPPFQSTLAAIAFPSLDAMEDSDRLFSFHLETETTQETGEAGSYGASHLGVNEGGASHWVCYVAPAPIPKPIAYHGTIVSLRQLVQRTGRRTVC